MINELTNLLINFGIETNIEEDGKITFFDEENNCAMKCWAPSHPGCSKLRDLTTTNEVIEPNKFIFIVSPYKRIRYILYKENINGEEITYIHEFIHEEMNAEGKTIKHDDAYFIHDERTNTIDISNNIVGWGNDKGILKEFHISDRSGITYKTNDLGGYFAYGEFQDRFANEMAKELLSNELLTIFSEYYGIYFPTLLEEVKVAKESSKRLLALRRNRFLYQNKEK